MRYSDFFLRAKKNTDQSAIGYKRIDVSAIDFLSDGPFRAVNVAAEGDIRIIGLNGADQLVHVLPGTNPLGGIGVKTAGSTVTDIVICY